MKQGRLLTKILWWEMLWDSNVTRSMTRIRLPSMRTGQRRKKLQAERTMTFLQIACWRTHKQHQQIGFRECWTLAINNAVGEAESLDYWPICTTARARVLGHLTQQSKGKEQYMVRSLPLAFIRAKCQACKCWTTCMCSRCKLAFECTTTKCILCTKKESYAFLPT